MKQNFFFWLSFSLVLVSCKSIEPIAPDNFIVPYPPLNNSSSTVTIPVELDLTNYVKTADKEVPRHFVGKNSQCEGISTSYEFNREDIKFTGSGNKVDYTVDGELKLKINYCPKCQTITNEDGACIIPRVYMSCGDKEPMRKFTLGYQTSVKVNSDYTLRTATDLKSFKLKDPCEMTIANIDVTTDVEKEITKQLKGLEQEIDKQLKGIDIKAIAKDTWNELQEPTLIPGYGYLTLSPTALGMSDLVFSKQKAKFNFCLDIAPSFTTEIPSVKKASLPSLSVVKEDKGLNFELDVIVSFDSLTSFIKSSMVGSSFKVKHKTISIDDIAVTGSVDNRIVLTTDISGAKKGRIYLLATPVLVDSLHVIKLTNVDFDIKTKSVLLKSAKWFFNSKITEMIEQKGIYDFQGMVNDIKNEINHSLTQQLTDEVQMDGAMNTIALKTLYYTNTHLVLRAQLDGKLKLIMK